MAVLDYVLQEELNRLQRYRSHLEADLAGIPKGAISIKIKAKHPYAYLSFREGKRVVSRYVGPADSAQAVELVNKVNERRRIAKELQAIASNMVRIKKMLHA